MHNTEFPPPPLRFGLVFKYNLEIKAGCGNSAAGVSVRPGKFLNVLQGILPRRLFLFH